MELLRKILDDESLDSVLIKKVLVEENIYEKVIAFKEDIEKNQQLFVSMIDLPLSTISIQSNQAQIDGFLQQIITIQENP